jgi:hypothetical protein
MLERMRERGLETADALRHYLTARKRIIVTVDTVQKDLHAMKRAGTVKQCGRQPWPSNCVLWGLVE